MDNLLPDALIVTAAQNIQNLCGLPFFKNTENVWKFYPPSKKINLSFNELIHPGWFDIKPSFIWGFYGKRSFLTARPIRSQVFDQLLKIHHLLSEGVGVITSSVNGEFLNSGFPAERVEEIYGNFRKLQCASNCSGEIWDLNHDDIRIDSKTKMADEFPCCPSCDGPARPNTLLFDDDRWNSERADGQRSNLNKWLGSLKGKNVHILELGVDSVDPCIELTTSGLSEKLNAKVFRVYPKNESDQGKEIEKGVEDYLALLEEKINA